MVTERRLASAGEMAIKGCEADPQLCEPKLKKEIKKERERKKPKKRKLKLKRLRKKIKRNDECQELTRMLAVCSPETKIETQIIPVPERKWEDHKGRTDMKKGRYTVEEKEILLKAIQNYFQESNLSWSEGLRHIFPQLSEGYKPRKKKGTAWTKIACCLPHRTVSSVACFALNHIVDWQKGPWTAAEERILMDAHMSSGGRRVDWAGLMRELWRPPFSCHQRWRELGPVLERERIKTNAKAEDVCMKKRGNANKSIADEQDSNKSCFSTPLCKDSNALLEQNSALNKKIPGMMKELTASVWDGPLPINDRAIRAKRWKHIRSNSVLLDRLGAEMLHAVREFTGVWAPYEKIPWKEIQQQRFPFVSDGALRLHYARHIFPKLIFNGQEAMKAGKQTVETMKKEGIEWELAAEWDALEEDSEKLWDWESAEAEYKFKHVGDDYEMSSTHDAIKGNNDISENELDNSFVGDDDENQNGPRKTDNGSAMHGTSDNVEDTSDSKLTASKQVKNEKLEIVKREADDRKDRFTWIMKEEELVPKNLLELSRRKHEIPHEMVLSRQAVRFIRKSIRRGAIQYWTDIDMKKCLPFWTTTTLWRRLKHHMDRSIPKDMKESSLKDQIEYLYGLMRCKEKKYKDTKRLALCLKLMKKFNGVQVSRNGVDVPLNAAPELVNRYSKKSRTIRALKHARQDLKGREKDAVKLGAVSSMWRESPSEGQQAQGVSYLDFHLLSSLGLSTEAVEGVLKS